MAIRKKKRKKKPIRIKNLWNEEWAIVDTIMDTKKKDYYFSNYGRIKSIDKVTENEQLLKGSIGPNGFRVLNLTLVDEVRQGLYIHHLVAKEFLPKPNEDQVFVAHLDGDKLNNMCKNLKWMNQEELTENRKRTGSYGPSKAREKRAVLSTKKVREIKRHLRDGTLTQVAMARRYGVSEVSIQKIKRGETWKHVVLKDDE